MGRELALIAVALLVGNVLSDDSLRSAIEAVQVARQQRDIPPAYYQNNPYGGQPEDIGYGYQKSVAPHTAGFFDASPIPEGALGSHLDPKAIEKLIIDYIQEEEDDADPNDLPPLFRRLPVAKKSIFREHGEASYPDAMQRMYTREDADEDAPVFLPSSFRERLSEPGKMRLRNLHALVKNYGGIDLPSPDNSRGFDDDEFVNAMNTIWEKYRDETGMDDPEDISDSDVEELMAFLSAKDQDKKRQYPGGYDIGYDFFNSPTAWNKRGESQYEDEPRPRPHMMQHSAFDERYPYKAAQKRFPVSKRSPAFYAAPGSSHHILIGHRHKKSTGQKTDPKVAAELNGIFSTDPKDENEPGKPVRVEIIAAHNGSKPGQKEESSAVTQSGKASDKKKKSIDWSQYFGIDRRKKKSATSAAERNWLLNQYLSAYGLDGKKIADKPRRSSSKDMDNKLQDMEDLIVDDAIKYTGAHQGSADPKKIQDVKDKVISDLMAAYSLEKMRSALNEFRSSMKAQQVNAPLSHSMASPLAKTEPSKKVVPVKKEASQDKVEASKKSVGGLSNSMNLDTKIDETKEGQDECPALDDIELRCGAVTRVLNEYGELLLPLCSLHQICYLCGTDGQSRSIRACDMSLLSEAHTLCQGDQECNISVRRMLTALRSMKAEAPLPTCDWSTQTCVARFLSINQRRRR